jgi:L1 cell adhesion molecule like protein
MDDEYIIGIDLGTTYTCAAVMRNDKIEVIPNNAGKRLTPSYVSFTKDERLIGNAAKNKSTYNLSNTIYSIKRIIGRNYSDEIVQEDIKKWPFKVIKDSEKDKPLIEVEYKEEIKKYYPQQISAMILGYVKKYSEEFVGKKINKAVITVPAYFNEAQKKATKEAGEIAGLEVIRILNEPTAAAIAYGYNINKKLDGKKNILVFDLGGGTYDVSILQIEKNKFIVLSINGDSHLGGEDFDKKLVEFCVKLFKDKTEIDISNNQKVLRRFKEKCEKIKEDLSESLTTQLCIDFVPGSDECILNINRIDFENVCKDLFKKLIPPIKEVLNDAKLEKEDIDDILLVGGSSRIPKIQEMLSEFFNNKELNKTVNPDEIVAEGAALQASILKEKGNIKIININPISLGIQTVKNGIKNYMTIMIPKNTPLPYTYKLTAETNYDNQISFIFKVFQGENELTDNNYFLNSFTISGLREAPAGKVECLITMELDENGILKCSANVNGDDNYREIQIESVNDLNEEQIDFFKNQEKNLQKIDQLNDQKEKDLIKLKKFIIAKKEEIHKFKNKNEILKLLNDKEKWIKQNDLNINQINDVINKLENYFNNLNL